MPSFAWGPIKARVFATCSFTRSGKSRPAHAWDAWCFHARISFAARCSCILTLVEAQLLKCYNDRSRKCLSYTCLRYGDSEEEIGDFGFTHCFKIDTHFILLATCPTAAVFLPFLLRFFWKVSPFLLRFLNWCPQWWVQSRCSGWQRRTFFWVLLL